MDTANNTQLQDPLLPDNNNDADDEIFSGGTTTTAADNPSSSSSSSTTPNQIREKRIRQLRWITVGSSAITVILELISLPGRILLQAWFYPAKAILTIYLIGFCLLIISSELIPDNYQMKLKDNIGILYHPFGRGLLLMIMAGMCCGVLGSSMWELIIVFPTLLLCSIGHFYCYFRYRNYFQQDEDFSGGDGRRALTFQEQGGGRLLVETPNPEIIQQHINTARSNALSWAIRSHINNMMNTSNSNNTQQEENQQEQEQESFLNNNNGGNNNMPMQQDIVS